MAMTLSDQQQERGHGDDGTSITRRASTDTRLSMMKWALVVPATAGLIVIISAMTSRGTTTSTTTTTTMSLRTTTTATTTTAVESSRDLQGVMSCTTDSSCPNLYCPEKPCTAFVCRENKCSVTTLTAETTAPVAPLITTTPSPTSAPVVANNNNNNNNTVNNTTNATTMPMPSPFPTPGSPTPMPTPPPTMNSTTTTTTDQQQQQQDDESEEYMFVGNDVCTKAVGPIPITAQGLGDSRAILVHGTTDSSSSTSPFLSATRQQQQQQSYAPVCNKISHSGPGAWYTVIGTGARMTASTCWPGSNYDTAISVYTSGNRRRRRQLKKEDGKDKDKDKDKEDEEEIDENDENNPGEDGAAGAGAGGGTGVCGSLQCVNANDDASGNFGSCTIKSTLSRVQWESVRGQTYYILVHGFFQRVGSFDLNVISARPLNERCVDATSIPINGPNIIGTTFQAQLPWGPDKATNCGGRFGLVGDTSSVWYKVRSDRTQTLEASTCNPLTDFDTKLHIFQGSCSNSGSCLGGNDNHNSPNRCSLTTWTAQAGTDYYILVHAFMFDNGLFDLTVRSL